MHRQSWWPVLYLHRATFCLVRECNIDTNTRPLGLKPNLRWEADYPPSQTVGSGSEPHWRPQPKLPSFGGNSLETLPYTRLFGGNTSCQIIMHIYNDSVEVSAPRALMSNRVEVYERGAFCRIGNGTRLKGHGDHSMPVHVTHGADLGTDRFCIVFRSITRLLSSNRVLGVRNYLPLCAHALHSLEQMHTLWCLCPG